MIFTQEICVDENGTPFSFSSAGNVVVPEQNDDLDKRWAVVAALKSNQVLIEETLIRKGVRFSKRTVTISVQ